jgi:hypothetical protein
VALRAALALSEAELRGESEGSAEGESEREARGEAEALSQGEGLREARGERLGVRVMRWDSVAVPGWPPLRVGWRALGEGEALALGRPLLGLML